MAFDDSNLKDYVDVAERIAEFRNKYPDGDLQPLNLEEPWRMVQIQGFEKNGEIAQQTFIAYTAAAYRTADDPKPGVGCAWEIWPGRTPYTRGSELMNAETSAWGRAIVAALAADTRKGIATKQDVALAQAAREPEPAKANGQGARKPMSAPQKIAMYLKRCGVSDDADRLLKVSILAERTDPIASSKELSDETLDRIAGELEKCRNAAQLEALLRSKVAAS